MASLDLLKNGQYAGFQDFDVLHDNSRNKRNH